MFIVSVSCSRWKKNKFFLIKLFIIRKITHLIFMLAQTLHYTF